MGNLIVGGNDNGAQNAGLGINSMISPLSDKNKAGF